MTNLDRIQDAAELAIHREFAKMPIASVRKLSRMKPESRFQECIISQADSFVAMHNLIKVNISEIFSEK